MTIGELCKSQESCGLCPFCAACHLLDVNAPYGFVEDDDKSITKSIIETTKWLICEGGVNYDD